MTAEDVRKAEAQFAVELRGSGATLGEDARGHPRVLQTHLPSSRVGHGVSLSSWVVERNSSALMWFRDLRGKGIE